ncbi:MAG: 3-hydroxyacyl-CoA dehydrogenase, partial [Akkermansiaceae bacterium]|nr:3-hydroxyacyl-CoA dehydrogenase [Akkermansiaceae bacterium]
TFDRQGSSANIFDREVLTDLSNTADELAARSDIKGLILRSAKPSIFIAGADLNALSTATGVGLNQLIELGQSAFVKVAALPFPTIAAIHGACVGGGFELALACDWRIASDSTSTKIGLPETGLGILPAWGGTTRLPRLIGLQNALPLILSGKILPAAAAKAKGLVDAVVPKDNLESYALTWIARGKRPVSAHALTNNPVSAALIAKMARAELQRKSRGLYPAPEAALEVATASSHGPVEAGLKRERDAIQKLSEMPQTKALMRLYFLQDKARKGVAVEGIEPRKVARCAVVGAGVMGAGIAYWLSSRGHQVVLRDIDDQALAKGMANIAKGYSDAVSHHVMTRTQADRGQDLVMPSSAPISLKNCDLIIEAAVENIDIKKKIFADLVARSRPDTILATNTSALPIRELAEVVTNPERLIGLHFFNPVHRMQLVEVVRTDATSDETLATAVAFVRSIGKLPIVVKDSPGFLVNRILMPYLVEAARMFEGGYDPATIDHAMLDFGMPMGPLRLLDEVGLDVAHDVAVTLSKAFPKRMHVPPVLVQLLAAGHLGKKSGSGFYVYDHEKATPNPAALALRSGTYPITPFVQEILAERMSREARLCRDEGVAASADDIDLAMILGTGYAPFRGGPLQYVNPILT